VLCVHWVSFGAIANKRRLPSSVLILHSNMTDCLHNSSGTKLTLKNAVKGIDGEVYLRGKEPVAKPTNMASDVHTEHAKAVQKHSVKKFNVMGDEKFTAVASDVHTEHAKSVQKHEQAKFNVMGDEKFTPVASDVHTEHAKAVQKHENHKFDGVRFCGKALFPNIPVAPLVVHTAALCTHRLWYCRSTGICGFVWIHVNLFCPVGERANLGVRSRLCGIPFCGSCPLLAYRYAPLPREHRPTITPQSLAEVVAAVAEVKKNSPGVVV
jgi:hypothetical protein